MANLISKGAKEGAKKGSVTYLKSIIADGQTINHVLRSVSSNGMSRKISFYIISPKTGEIENIDYWLSCALELRLAKGDYGLIVQGCGQDMGWSVVKRLERALDFKLLNSRWI